MFRQILGPSAMLYVIEKYTVIFFRGGAETDLCLSGDTLS
jgi:hypothetical protein